MLEKRKVDKASLLLSQVNKPAPSPSAMQTLLSVMSKCMHQSPLQADWRLHGGLRLPPPVSSNFSQTELLEALENLPVDSKVSNFRKIGIFNHFDHILLVRNGLNLQLYYCHFVKLINFCNPLHEF